MANDCTIVVDIGKTHSKVSLWSDDGQMIDRRTRANRPQRATGYQALDVDGIDAWLMQSLGELARSRRIGQIVPVGHGAAAALLRGNQLHVAPVDYEHEISAADRADYDIERDSFDLTGSPSLPCGLNLGRQLHYLERLRGPLPDDVVIVPWAQYWAWRLCGIAASEVTSLGCHTDLWRPHSQDFSALAVRRGWAARFAPIRPAAARLGRITPEVMRQTGLPADCEVLCGLHDSNAALLAARGHTQIAGGDATVLSTGTWFVAMRSPGEHAAVDIELDPDRDCLVNVDVAGRPVPSARFMGGREAQLISGIDSFALTDDYHPDQLLARLPRLVAQASCVYPSFVAGVGPFPRSRGEWHNRPATADDQRVVAGLYLALMADAALDLIGSRRRLLIEGRFAEAVIFVRALATLRPGQQVFVSNAHQDVACGALRLIHPDLRPPCDLTRVDPLDTDLTAYAAQWRGRAGAARVTV